MSSSRWFAVIYKLTSKGYNGSFPVIKSLIILVDPKSPSLSIKLPFSGKFSYLP